jgi:hypothetical protein
MNDGVPGAVEADDEARADLREAVAHPLAHFSRRELPLLDDLDRLVVAEQDRGHCRDAKDAARGRLDMPQLRQIRCGRQRVDVRAPRSERRRNDRAAPLGKVERRQANCRRDRRHRVGDASDRG